MCKKKKEIKWNIVIIILLTLKAGTGCGHFTSIIMPHTYSVETEIRCIEDQFISPTAMIITVEFERYMIKARYQIPTWPDPDQIMDGFKDFERWTDKSNRYMRVKIGRSSRENIKKGIQKTFVDIDFKSNKQNTNMYEIVIIININSNIVQYKDKTRAKIEYTIHIIDRNGNITENHSIIGTASKKMKKSKVLGLKSEELLNNATLGLYYILTGCPFTAITKTRQIIETLSEAEERAFSNLMKRLRTSNKLHQIDMAWLNVSNVTFKQMGNTIHISYDLKGKKKYYSVKIKCSDDGGETFKILNKSIYGDVGLKVSPGSEREIIWDVLKDYPKGIKGDKFLFKVEAR